MPRSTFFIQSYIQNCSAVSKISVSKNTFFLFLKFGKDEVKELFPVPREIHTDLVKPWEITVYTNAVKSSTALVPEVYEYVVHWMSQESCQRGGLKIKGFLIIHTHQGAELKLHRQPYSWNSLASEFFTLQS